MAEQIEKGSLKDNVSARYRKVLKKLHKRKKRRESKKNNYPPQYNRYEGHSF